MEDDDSKEESVVESEEDVVKIYLLSQAIYKCFLSLSLLLFKPRQGEAVGEALVSKQIYFLPFCKPCAGF